MCWVYIPMSCTDVGFCDVLLWSIHWKSRSYKVCYNGLNQQQFRHLMTGANANLPLGVLATVILSASSSVMVTLLAMQRSSASLNLPLWINSSAALSYCPCWNRIISSVNQPMNQPIIHQSINRWINQSFISQSTNQSTNQSNNQSTNQSII